MLATVTEVEVYDACTGRACWADDEVRVHLDGARHTLRGVTDAFGDVPQDEWAAPQAGTRYAPPLAVTYDPDAPERVMADADLAEYADGGLLATSLVVLVVTGAVTVVLLGLALWRVGLPYLLGWRIT